MNQIRRGLWVDEGFRILVLVLVCIMMLLGFSMLGTIVVMGRLKTVGVFELLDDPNGAFLIATLPLLLSLFFVPFAWEHWFNRRSSQDLLLNWPSTRQGHLLIGVSAALAVYGAVSFWNPMRGLLPLIHLMAIAVSEEFLFRSVVQARLARLLNPGWTILLTAVAFAFVVHSGKPLIDNLVLRLPIAIVFGIVTQASRSVWPAVLLHFAHNSVVTM